MPKFKGDSLEADSPPSLGARYYGGGDFTKYPESSAELNDWKRAYDRIAGQKVTHENRGDFSKAVIGIKSLIGEVDKHFGKGLAKRESYTNQTTHDTSDLVGWGKTLVELETAIREYDESFKD